MGAFYNRTSRVLLAGLLAAVVAGTVTADDHPPAPGAVKLGIRDGIKIIYNEPTAARSRRLAGNLLPVPDPTLVPIIERHSSDRQLEPQLVQAVIQVESGYNPRAVSRKGAMGLMQLMPETATLLAVRDPFDPADNVRGGTTYLRRMLDRFDERLELALAAYNAGPTAVERYAGIPPYRETRGYVARILDLVGGEGAEPPLLRRKPFLLRGPDGRWLLTTERP